MNYKQTDIDRFFKNPDAGIKCVLLFGTNEGMIADLFKKFASSVCPDLTDAFRVAYLQTEALEKDIGLLYGEYNATSLTGGRRVVLIKDANNNLTKPLKDLFENSSSDTFVVLSSTTLNTKSSLVNYLKDCENAAVVACYDDREQSISAYVSDFFVKNKITIAADAMQLLCQRLSADRKASAGELEKLLTYIGHKRNVTFDDVQKAVSNTAASSVEDLCYYVCRADTQKALQSYAFLLSEGEEPVMILRALTYHFLRLLECAAETEQGKTADMVAGSLKPPLMFFRKPDFVGFLKTFKRDFLFDILALLYKAQRDCKTTGNPAEEIASYTLMQISGAVKKIKARADFR
ncbi:MAG: DNA polymerase III subunit delta [Alphaproteobacteria bacterium]|nr:DNA polymerase III subunit delta [Alphaproteobacteria bacterium]